jgi:16S rRNA (adenine1518-N6/adenine1519-N6)-dimethyltransferase
VPLPRVTVAYHRSHRGIKRATRDLTSSLVAPQIPGILTAVPPPGPKTLLARYGLTAKRSWSQSFLADPGISERIAAACEISREDVVVEIGAGLGHLTHALAARAGQVIAVERDRDLAQVLRFEFQGSPGVQVVEANALRFDVGEVATRYGRRVVAVGNLPYHLSSQILLRLLDERTHLRTLVLMFQKELARRLVAPPGSRDFGVLTVLARLHADIRVALHVSRGAFYPRPKVDSTVVRFDLLATPRPPVADEPFFREVVHAAFACRRKTLRNALHSAFKKIPEPALAAAFGEAGIDPTARAETLGVEALAALSDALYRIRPEADGGG